MRVRRSLLNWGAFLVCLGIVPLAVQLGALDRTAAGELLRLWPIILVVIGVGLLLRFSRFEALGGMLSAGTFGLVVGVFFAGGLPGAAAACNASQTAGPVTTRSGEFSGESAALTLELTCADIDMTRASGGSWSVQVSGGSGEPTIDADAVALRLRSPNGGRFNPFGGDRREQWTVTLPTEQSLSANLTINAATASLVLGGAPLSNLNATFNASDARLDLSGDPTGTTTTVGATLNASTVRLVLPSTSASGGLTLNAASLELCAPEASGIQVTYEDTLSSHNFAAAGLVQNGRTWQSPGYDSAAIKIDLRVTANVSSITLSRAGGCP